MNKLIILFFFLTVSVAIGRKDTSYALYKAQKSAFSTTRLLSKQPTNKALQYSLRNKQRRLSALQYKNNKQLINQRIKNERRNSTK